MEKKRKEKVDELKRGRVSILTILCVCDRNLRGSAALVAILFRSILLEFVSSGTSVGFFVFFFLFAREEGRLYAKKGDEVVGLESV